MKKILTFLIIVLVLSSLGYYLCINSKALGISFTLSIFYLMWCPGIAGMATYLFYDRNIKGIGWGPGDIKWLGFGYILPFLYAAVAYAFIWLAELGKMNSQYHFSFMGLVVFGTLMKVLYAAGEEIGWRGFLAPELYKRVGYTASCFITGIIWAVWHFPLIIAGSYLSNMPLLPQLGLFVITVTAITFIFNWFRLRSGSVWPSILLHGSHNLYIQSLFDPLTLSTGPLTKFMMGESGVVLTVIYVALAFVFWCLRRKLPSPATFNS